ncbi:MAG: thioredoxin family protein, partial [Saprospiraceae bacterium]|nr:thioredoxin family protein [Saprospiraceae bacterium]
EIRTAGDDVELVFTAKIDAGWGVYSQFLESDEGPIATSINYETPDLALIGKAEESGHRKEGYDAIFEMNVIKFAEDYIITQKIKAKEGSRIKGYLTYMTCDDTKCLPPTDVDFDFIVPTKGGQNDDAKVESSSDLPTDDLGSIGEVELPAFDLTDDINNTDEIYTPVEWEASYANNRVIFTAHIDEGWHIYDQVIDGDDGPIPTEFYFDSIRKVLPSESEYILEEIDEFFGGIVIKKFKKEVHFTYEVPHDSGRTEGEIVYMACNSDRCTPPTTVSFTIDPEAQSVTLVTEDDLYSSMDMGGDIYPVPPIDLDNPVGQCGDVEMANVKRKTLFSIFLLGFVGGLLALLTPCVFPMIPLTVSFFTKNSGNRSTGMRQAFLYGFFILLVYLLLSLPFHLLDSVDPGILNDISTNVGLNIFFFLIFVFFAFSFFGFYEITLPSRWTNQVSRAESVGGMIGVFFMALTLALVSFSCTGPILGSLLAGALTSEGGAMQLTAGMGGFGLALALPFALFAAFPSMLSALPRSGGWLNTVKVVLGFLELALAFKFLSNADLVKNWGILKIEPFLIIWTIIFIGLSIYLFGKWKFPHDSPMKKLSAWRLLGGVASLAFAVYLMTGFTVDQDKGTLRSLTLLSGLAPPAGYSWLRPKECPNNLDCFKDLAEGVAYARKVDKPIMIDFTGHACVNCRKMEEHVWPREEVNNMLQNDFILISLYVDEKIALPEEEQTEAMRNYGEKWKYFQTKYFNNNSQPLYALITPDGQLLNNPVGYTPDAEEYAAFLECGLTAFKEIKGTEQLGSSD